MKLYTECNSVWYWVFNINVHTVINDYRLYSKHRSSILMLMVKWIIGLILHGGPIELFLIPASAPQLV